MKRLTPILLSGVLLAACNDPPQGPSPVPDFRISPSQQWSGGVVTISPVRPGRLPVMVVGPDTVIPEHQNDTTLAFRVPLGASETLDVRVDGNLAGQVVRVGFRQRRELNGGTILTFAQFPEGPVGLGYSALGPGMWSLGSGQHTTIAGLTGFGGFSPGPSFRGQGFWMFTDNSGAVSEWELWPSIMPVDTMPVPFQGARVTVAMSPGVYLLGFSNHTTTYVSGLGSRDFLGSKAERGFLSIEAGRAFLHGGGPGGVTPVFDARSGDSVYSLPLRYVRGAAFTRDGARLYLVGGQSPSFADIMSIDAGTGDVIVSDSLQVDMELFDVTLDLSETLLFVAADSAGLPRVLVLDATNLGRVGTLAIPNDAPESCAQGLCFANRVTTDESRRTVYLSMYGDPIPLYEFDLLR